MMSDRPLIYVDEQGRLTGYDDVHTMIELCRSHYRQVGLGEDYVRQFIR
jgi:2,4'-dihydroxyacetophenone dioxygenase